MFSVKAFNHNGLNTSAAPITVASTNFLSCGPRLRNALYSRKGVRVMVKYSGVQIHEADNNMQR